VKTIQVKADTKRQLDAIGSKGDTYDVIIRKLIETYLKQLELKLQNVNFGDIVREHVGEIRPMIKQKKRKLSVLSNRRGTIYDRGRLH